MSIPLLILVMGCGNGPAKPTVRFPSEVVMSAGSPDSSITAVLYTWDADEKDMLGTYNRWCLGFTQGGTKWYVDRELGEGKGSYEGGVYSVEWLDNGHVKVNRRIDDQDANLVFNVKTYSFAPAK